MEGSFKVVVVRRVQGSCCQTWPFQNLVKYGKSYPESNWVGVAMVYRVGLMGRGEV